MPSVPVGAIIRKSFERTILILLKPFSLKKWLLLVVIASLAGSLGGSSGNFGGGDSRRDEKAGTQQEETIAPLPQEGAAEEYALQESPAPTQNAQCPLNSGPRRSLRERFQGIINSYGRTLVFSAIAALVLFVLALLIFFSWLGARFKFIWLEAIIKNDASIREPFGRYKREGDSLFKFFLALFAAFIAWVGLLGAWAWAAASSIGLLEKGADVSFLAAVKVFVLPVVVFIAGLIAFAVIGVIVEHFVVAIMGVGRCLFSEAWRKCMQIAAQNRLDFFLFFLVLIGLGIASGIAALIVLLVYLLLALLVGALLFGLPYLLLAVAFKVPVIFYIYAVVLGIPFAVAAVIALICVSLPFAVFFRNFSLYYLAGLAPEYAALPLAQAQPAPQ